MNSLCPMILFVERKNKTFYLWIKQNYDYFRFSYHVRRSVVDTYSFGSFWCQIFCLGIYQSSLFVHILIVPGSSFSTWFCPYVCLGFPYLDYLVSSISPVCSSFINCMFLRVPYVRTSLVSCSIFQRCSLPYGFFFTSVFLGGTPLVTLNFHLFTS